MHAGPALPQQPQSSRPQRAQIQLLACMQAQHCLSEPQKQATDAAVRAVGLHAGPALPQQATEAGRRGSMSTGAGMHAGPALPQQATEAGHRCSSQSCWLACRPGIPSAATEQQAAQGSSCTCARQARANEAGAPMLYQFQSAAALNLCQLTLARGPCMHMPRFSPWAPACMPSISPGTIPPFAACNNGTQSPTGVAVLALGRPKTQFRSMQR
jgi:hypothetical protein